MRPEVDAERITQAAGGGPHNRVIVGIDGSQNSRIASTWAAAEASRRGVPLTVAYALCLTSSAPVPPPPEPYGEHWGQQARAMLRLRRFRVAGRVHRPPAPRRRSSRFGPSART